MICPACNGEKEIVGLFPVYGDEVPREKRKPIIAVPCDFCYAKGEVDNGYPERVERGEKAKLKRLSYELTLREFCKRFDLDILLVSYYERGKKIRSKEEQIIRSVYDGL